MNMYMPIDIVQMSCLYGAVPFYSIQKLYKLNDIHDILSFCFPPCFACIRLSMRIRTAHNFIR